MAIYTRLRRPLLSLTYALWAVGFVLFVCQFVFDREISWWGVPMVVAAGINVVDAFRPGRSREEKAE